MIPVTAPDMDLIFLRKKYFSKSQNIHIKDKKLNSPSIKIKMVIIISKTY